MRNPEPVQIEPDAWCEWCGDPLPEPEERHTRRRFCSRACRTANRNALLREEWAATLKELDCAHCGTRFKQARACQVYCNPKCQANARYRQLTGRPVAVEAKDCPQCGKSFTPRNLAQQFCSKPCRWKAEYKRRKG